MRPTGPARGAFKSFTLSLSLSLSTVSHAAPPHPPPHLLFLLRPARYGTAHSLAPVDPALLVAWASPPAVDPALHLPAPNAFVATDFSLRPPPAAPVAAKAAVGSPAAASLPTMVHDDAVLRVWYKHFGPFAKPKTNVMVALSTPEV